MECSQRDVCRFMWEAGLRVLAGDHPEAGLRIPLGLSYLLSQAPVEIFAEIVPVVEFAPDTSGEVDGAIGVRYYFKPDSPLISKRNCYYLPCMANVRTGLDVLLAGNLKMLKDARVGVLSHQASVDSQLRHIVHLLQSRQIRITTLFAPEHGFLGKCPGFRSPSRRTPPPFPSIAFTAKNARRPQRMLANVDVLVCDLQGCRESLLHLRLDHGAGDAGPAPNWERNSLSSTAPNPINGQTLEGPVLTRLRPHSSVFIPSRSTWPHHR